MKEEKAQTKEGTNSRKEKDSIGGSVCRSVFLSRRSLENVKNVERERVEKKTHTSIPSARKKKKIDEMYVRHLQT